MKHTLPLLLVVFIMAMVPSFGQSSTEQSPSLLFHSSQGALAGAVAYNVVQSFKPHYDPIPTSFPILITGPKIIPADTLGRRTASLAFGTVGMLGAEHFVINKWPRTRRWFTVVNFGAGAFAAGFAQR